MTNRPEPDGIGPALDAALPLMPQLYRLLRRRIVTNALPPGSLLSQPEIARDFKVSRQPVREAFIRLEEQGLVVVLAQRGTLVSKISHAAVLDARFLREAIEADIVRIVAERRDPALPAALRAQLGEQRAAARRRSAEQFIRLDERFHLMLAEGAGMPGAWKMIEGLKSQMDRVRFLSLEQFPINRLIAQHGAVVERIADGDAPAAEAAIRLHLRQMLKDLPDIVSANPLYFELPGEGASHPAHLPSSEV